MGTELRDKLANVRDRLFDLVEMCWWRYIPDNNTSRRRRGMLSLIDLRGETGYLTHADAPWNYELSCDQLGGSKTTRPSAPRSRGFCLCGGPARAGLAALAGHHSLFQEAADCLGAARNVAFAATEILNLREEWLLEPEMDIFDASSG